ncbi:scavenger receptor cysteine-rich type 1 protein M130-like [Rhincodon typus]|uniref:scavenger receptor cysteine-rich type 1 protein M130-like n=1 Tax=Rhincodon typus TaxID=259920 RepID=UPI00202EB528|nr:scavenger receptor cysteine-rich type 1 protein M130-like [Rhincodon typus]
MQRDLGLQLPKIDTVVKKSYGILTFLSRGIEYLIFKVRLVARPTFGMFHTVLVVTLPEGYGGFVECTETVYQDVAWFGGHWLQEEIGQTRLRLENGGSPCAGRVEIHYMGPWGSVNDLGWDLPDATVVCREMNCGTAVSAPGGTYFGQGSGPIVTWGVECSGTEHGLREYENLWPRLVIGESHCDGRVEILYNGSWSSPQNTLWDLNGADVVCRQLGCSYALETYNFSKYGEIDRCLRVYSIQCLGQESQLRDCKISSPLNSSVTVSSGVGILCSEHIQLRLSDGGSRCAGRVEIYYKGTWGSVCDDSWDLGDAEVVYKQLGCGNILDMTLPSSYGPGSGPVWLKDVKCSGNDSFPWECPSAQLEHKDMRLVNGKHLCEGRVEVFCNRTWGTVCLKNLERHDAEVICKQLHCGALLFIDYYNERWGTLYGDSWDITDASVVCRQLRCLYTGGRGSILGLYQGIYEEIENIPSGKKMDQKHGPVISASIELLNRIEYVSSRNLRDNNPESEYPEVNSNSFPGRVVDTQAERGETVKVRVVNGGSPCAGRVEVHYQGLWGTLYDFDWDLPDATVVCRELGCGIAVSAPGGAHFGQGSGLIVTTGVVCSGDERALRECQSLHWGHYGFPHSNDAGVICSGFYNISQENVMLDSPELIYYAELNKAGKRYRKYNRLCYCLTEHINLRLSDGGSPCAGRLELYYKRTWGSVCDDSWDVMDAEVVCKQLGCGNTLEMTFPSSYGPGSGPVWLKDVKCSGNESFLWDCPSAELGHQEDCSHKEDVRIMCSEHKEMRLVNGKHRCEGRVEVFYNGTWGTVCSESLDIHDAEVICKQLHCGVLISIDYYTRLFGAGRGPIWLDEVDCLSHETTLWECQTEPWGQHNCEHREDAGVICSESDVRKEQPLSSNFCQQQPDSQHSVRLDGGSSNCSGRVEIMCDVRWGTLCGDSWDITDANVVCRQLRCGFAVSAQGGPAVSQGKGVIWQNDVKCKGSESYLSDCLSPALAQRECNPKEFASVICSVISTSIDLLDRFECDTSQKLSDNNLGSENPGVTSNSIPGPIHRDDDSTETESQDDQPELDRDSDEALTLTNVGCGLCSLGIVTMLSKSAMQHRAEQSHHQRMDPKEAHKRSNYIELAVSVYVKASWWEGLDDNLWDLNAGHVVCRQLGCGYTLETYNSSKYGRAKDICKFLVSSVMDRKHGCKIAGLQDHRFRMALIAISSSNINSDMFTIPNLRGTIQALAIRFPKQYLQLRQSNGGSPCSGRVEIYYKDTWGSVCDDSWDVVDAEVVCRQLGCGNALDMALPSSDGLGSGPVWSKDVKCSSNESFLWECSSAQLSHQDICSHKVDVRITCSEHKEMRLVNGKHRCEGRVEVLYNGTWGAVCSDSLDSHDAKIICKQLECGVFHYVDYETQLIGTGTGHIWLNEMECLSHEPKLWQCQTDPWGQNNCNHWKHAGVVCSDLQHSVLDGGSSNCSGRVKVMCDERWGTLCGDSWDLTDANVVCGRLRYGFAVMAQGGRAASQGERVIWNNDVKSISASSDSFNRIEYYTSHNLSDNSLEQNSNSIQGPIRAVYDDIETEEGEFQDGQVQLDSDLMSPSR